VVDNGSQDAWNGTDAAIDGTSPPGLAEPVEAVPMSGRNQTFGPAISSLLA
jgi:hypothetical protein